MAKLRGSNVSSVNGLLRKIIMSLNLVVSIDFTKNVWNCGFWVQLCALAATKNALWVIEFCVGFIINCFPMVSMIIIYEQVSSFTLLTTLVLPKLTRLFWVADSNDFVGFFNIGCSGSDTLRSDIWSAWQRLSCLAQRCNWIFHSNNHFLGLFANLLNKNDDLHQPRSWL